jgi:hypothetical protein
MARRIRQDAVITSRGHQCLLLHQHRQSVRNPARRSRLQEAPSPFCSVSGHIIGLVQLGYRELTGEPTLTRFYERTRTPNRQNRPDINVI